MSYESSPAPAPVSIDTRDVTSFEVEVSMPEPSHYKFTFLKNYIFPSPILLYTTLREVLTEYIRAGLDDPEEKVFLPLKFASRVLCSNFPVIHNPRDHTIFIDPLQTVRDAVMEVNRTRVIVLEQHPSRPYFYRPKTPADQFPPNPSPQVQRSRTIVAPSHPPHSK